MLFKEFEVEGRTYKLALNTRSIMELEKKIGCNPVAIFGEEGKTHGQILADYMEELGNEDMIPEDLKGDDIAGSRPTQSRMRRLVDTDNVAFGHIVDNMAFVEVLETGANEDDVVKACKKQLKVDKVYFLDNDYHIVKRLAKWKVYTE